MPTHVELKWVTGRLAPDFKTIADFRKQEKSCSAVESSILIITSSLLGTLNCASALPIWS